MSVKQSDYPQRALFGTVEILGDVVESVLVPIPESTPDARVLESDSNSGLELDQELSPMKPMRLTEDILPLAEFKTQASRVLRQLKESQRPVIITQNGRPAAVLISPHDFDQMRERDGFMAAVREALADSEAGRVFGEDGAGRMLGARYGLLA